MYEEIIGSDDDNRPSENIIDNEMQLEDFLNAANGFLEIGEKSAKIGFLNDFSENLRNEKEKMSDASPDLVEVLQAPSFEAKSRLNVGQPRNKPQLLSTSFKELLERAERDTKIKDKKISDMKRDSTALNEMINLKCPKEPNSSMCWASKYRPSKFTHLISDDMINRLVLKWLKLWDPFIFKSSTPSFANNKKNLNYRSNSMKKRGFKSSYDLKMERLLEFDEITSLPRFRILLINGEPGMGKTVLVHIVAKHCGYDIMEINASDERTPENFQTLFKKTSTVKNSIKSGRPICLVFDEIDGAPKKSLDILLEYGLNGCASSTKKTSKCIPRPIICICNNLFAPCLNKLRQHAFVINFPPIRHDKIVFLLKKIVLNEVPDMLLNDDYLYRIVTETNGDIRSSINNLQFYVLGQSIENDHLDMDIVSKDRQLSLYDMWKWTFHSNFRTASAHSQPFQHISNLVNQCSGNVDRYIYGLFENYGHLLDIPSRYRNFYVTKVCKELIFLRNDICAQYFQLFDQMSTLINQHQQYGPLYGLKNTVPAYALHLALSYDCTKHPYRFVYPSGYYQSIDILNRNKELMHRIQCGVSVYSIRETISTIAATYDLIYYLASLVQPTLKNINLYMMTQNEKTALRSAAYILLENNISIKSYQQQLSSTSGQYPTDILIDYQFEPNIRQLSTFPGVVRYKPSTSDSVMQLLQTTMENLSAELKSEKIRKNLASVKAGATENNANKPSDSPLILKTLPTNTKTNQNITTKRDFFGRLEIHETSKISNPHFSEISNKENSANVITGKDSRINNENTEICKKSKVKFDQHLYYAYKQGSATTIVRRTKYSELFE